jgi:hypothetical protein
MDVVQLEKSMPANYYKVWKGYALTYTPSRNLKNDVFLNGLSL